MPRGLDFLECNKLLREYTETLLGPSPANRAVRIMVTMPGEAASDYQLVRELVARGMNCMRVNCSYDDRQAWVAMAEHLKRARRELGKECRLSMDLAGPKLRVGPMETGLEVTKVRPVRDVTGMVLKPARIRLAPQAHAGAVASVGEPVPIPVAAGDLGSLRAGDKIEFTDTRGSSWQMVVTGRTGECVETESGRTSAPFPRGKRPKRIGGLNPLCSTNEALRTARAAAARSLHCHLVSRATGFAEDPNIFRLFDASVKAGLRWPRIACKLSTAKRAHNYIFRAPIAREPRTRAPDRLVIIP